jgi:hypothetical protein
MFEDFIIVQLEKPLDKFDDTSHFAARTSATTINVKDTLNEQKGLDCVAGFA